MGAEDGHPLSSWAAFGNPSRFEIATRWTSDREARARRPADGGWSTGELRLTVGRHVLTKHERGGETRDAIGWYLFPVFEWLAEHWISLLHEERFAWRENSAAPAATALFFALRRFIVAEDSAERARYADVQAWWSRHALQAADPSAIYPDVVFRRFSDAIEVSWTARQPAFAPAGFQLALAPGAAILPVEEVAQPIWEALAWVVSTAEVLEEKDRSSVLRLEKRIAELAASDTSTLEAGFLPSRILSSLNGEQKLAHQIGSSRRLSASPAINEWSDAVLMFGGVNPDIAESDIGTLSKFLVAHHDGSDSAELARFVDTSIGAPLSAPFEEGYDCAERLLDELNLPDRGEAIDIEGLLTRLSVSVMQHRLCTDSIRGVALAGPGYVPAILINESSYYNRNGAGQRFTLAHELFHILYDRTRARRIAHTSGPWAAPGIEKRANAFAAMLLMPRELVRRYVSSSSPRPADIQRAADLMRVSVSALVEHLYNMSSIDEVQRERLRGSIRSSS